MMWLHSTALVALLFGVHSAGAAADGGQKVYNMAVKNTAVHSVAELRALAVQMDDEAYPLQRRQGQTLAGGAEQSAGAIEPYFYSVSMSLTPAQLAHVQSRFAGVLGQVEEDGVVYATAMGLRCGDMQEAPVPWGLRRTVAGASVPEGFRHNASWGEGVDVYVVDSGVDCTHPDLQGRCVQEFSTFSSHKDLNGHGTHVAGTAAGTQFGFAKSARIVAVRVLGADASGPTSGVIEGIKAAVTHKRASGRRGVINMSLGGTGKALLDAAVVAAVRSGLTVVVSAGNENDFACSYSPARESEAVTVGATMFTGGHGDKRAWFSNYGECVDLFAPGVRVNSSRSSHTPRRNAPPHFDLYRTYSGTSMATPLVAGVAAAYISEQAAEPTPAQVTEWLLNNTLEGLITEGFPNKLLHVPCEGADSPQPAGYTAVDENCYETYMDLENATEGTLAFPADDSYSSPDRFEACWRIECDAVVQLVWTAVDLAYRSNVHVYNATNASYPTLLELEGSRRFPTSYHAGPVVVRFTSSYSEVGMGFTLQYSCIPEALPIEPDRFPQQCTNETEILDANATNSIRLDYGTDKNHCWRIECDKVVQLTWETFKLESGFDYVFLYRDVNGSFPLERRLSAGPLPSTMFLEGPVVVQLTGGSWGGSRRELGLQFSCIPEELIKPDLFPQQCTNETEILDADATNITHLNYGPNENHCWRIECNKTVELRWETFDLGWADYIRIYHDAGGDFPVLSILYSPSVPPTTYHAGPLVVQFTSGARDIHTGFVLQFSCLAEPPAPTPALFPYQCSNETEILDANVTTNITLVDYGTNENHCWRIECDKFVELRWQTFDLAFGYDYVQIYREISGDFPMLERLQGNTIPLTLYHPGPVVVQFVSGYWGTGGFELQFSCIAEVPARTFPQQCTNETEILDADATNITHLNYGPNENHCWRIECNKTMELRWETFDTERGSDYVQIYLDIGSESYFPLVEKLHGSTIPPTMYRTYPVVVQFTSGSRGMGEGFVLQFSCIDEIPPPPAPTFPEEQCTNETEILAANATNITRLDYDINDNHCWRIECDGTVEFTWEVFHTELYYDHMRIYRDANGAFSLVEELSGSSLPPTMYHAGPVVVQFTSDFSVQHAGFILQFVCLPPTSAPLTPLPTSVPTTPTPTSVPTTVAPTSVPTTPAPTSVPTTVAPTSVPTTPAPTSPVPRTPVPETAAPATPAPTDIPAAEGTVFCRSTQECRHGLLDPASTCVDGGCVCATPGYSPVFPSVPLCVGEGVSHVLVSFSILYAAAVLSQWTEATQAEFKALLARVLGVVTQADAGPQGGLWVVGLVQVDLAHASLISGKASLADALNAAGTARREATVLALAELGPVSSAAVHHGQACTADDAVHAVPDTRGVCHAVQCTTGASRVEVSGQFRCVLETAAPATPGPLPGSDDDSGLSEAQKIGIGVGVGVGGALLLCVLAAVFCVCRKSPAPQPKQNEPIETA